MTARLRLVQAGRGDPRDVVILYFLAADRDAWILAAVGPAACVVNVTPGPYSIAQGLPTLAATLRWADVQTGGGWSPRHVVGAGWSAGCAGWRSQLANGAAPAALVLADGIHSTLPPAAAHLALWGAAAGRARRRETVLIASHSSLTYVEDLPPAERYSSVTRMLREITGWPLAEVGTASMPRRTADGHLVVYATRGRSNADPAEHRAHALVLLPRMLREAMSLLAGDSTADTDPAPVTTPTGSAPPGTSLRDVALDVCLEEAQRWAGKRPSPGRIAEYFAGCERGGRRLGLTSGNYCAAGQGWAEHVAAARAPELVVERAPPWRAAAKEIMSDARAGLRGRWLSADEVRGHATYRPPPGSLAVYHRGPPGVWTGHVDRVVAWRDVAGPEYRNVGANEAGGAWGDSWTPLGSPALLGFVIDGTEPVISASGVSAVPVDAIEPELTDADVRQIRGLDQVPLIDLYAAARAEIDAEVLRHNLEDL